MEVAGIIIPVWGFLAVCGVICAFGIWSIASAERKINNPHKQWSPDVDQTKAKTIANKGVSGNELQ